MQHSPQSSAKDKTQSGIDWPQSDRRKSRCLLIFVTLSPVLLICNPLVLRVIMSKETLIEIPYVLLLDLLVLGILWLCYRYVRTGMPSYYRAALIGLIALPFGLAAIEALALQNRADYQRLTGATPRPEGSDRGILRRDDRLGWSNRPGAMQDDPEIVIDDAGRRHTPPPADGVTRNLHAFGDSFLYGLGIGQDQNGLNLLAERYRDRIAVLNYAVSGYGLDQMVLRLEDVLDTIAPGDLVIFAPITNDFYRNLITKQLVCAHYENGLAGDVFPRWVDGQWRYEDLEDHCPELGMPMSNLLGIIKKGLGVTERQLVAYADDVLRHAMRLVQDRGATFALVFQPNYKECKKGRFDIDLEGLTVPYHHLMPACADFDPAVEYMLSDEDYHWNRHGHRWFADALGRLIEAEGWIETNPAISARPETHAIRTASRP